MQYYKLSFSVLMISTFFIQSVNAREQMQEMSDETLDLSEIIRDFSSMFINGKVLKNSSIATQGVSMHTKIEEGGLEIVENNGTSTNAIVSKGGKQLITRGATAISTRVEGGSQFIFEENPRNLGTESKRSSAYDAIIVGTNGNSGQQNVYDGGEAWNTKVMGGGIQYLYKGKTAKGGFASNTEVSSNGKQLVLAGGEASGVTLKDKALQVVYPDGTVKNLTIQDQAQSWVHVGANLTGATRVNGRGYLHFYAGDDISYITKEDITLEGRSPEKLFSVGARNGNRNSDIQIEDLGGNGGTIGFSSVEYDKRHSKLHIEKLSGNLHFNFNISDVGEGSDYIFIKNGSGKHTISVADSGREITTFFSQSHGRIAEINLVTDTSENGEASFTLVNSAGESISAIDGGAYMYTLQERNKSGNWKVWSLSADIGQSRYISPPPKRLIQKPVPNFPSTSNGKSDKSKLKNNKNSRQHLETRSRPPRHVRQSEQSSLALSSGEVQTSLYKEYQNDESKSRKRILQSHDSGDGGTYNYPVLSGSPILDSKQLKIPDIEVVPYKLGQQIDVNEEIPAYSNQIPAYSSRLHLKEDTSLEDLKEDTNLEDQESAPQLMNQDDEEQFPILDSISTPALSTTPSTDALLSLSVAPELIFKNELQSLRAGRGFLGRNKKSTSLWTYGIKSKENLSTDHTNFKLDQTGIILGIDGLNDLMNGQLYIGGFGSYDQSDIAHARGGISRINTYGVGAYATYFSDRGWYLDSILKYNYYQNNLKAISTNGLNIKGDYNQKAIGTSFEVGRHVKLAQDTWVQPYAQLIWLKVEGKEVKLSNEMTGNISPYTSLRSEIGISIGHELNLGTPGQMMTYLTTAWLHEYIDNNHTIINKRHKFNTDLSGNVGKFGVGLNSFVSENLNFYVEAHYLRGKKTKQSLQGVLGLRYSF
ncbi:BafA family autotransporter [Bartonella sp. C271]|uniref:BafA family autotransporter n=1 Tax=Bartonella sp. C271 TaxID=3070220 RepID=UPI0038B4D8ED